MAAHLCRWVVYVDERWPHLNMRRCVECGRVRQCGK